MTEIKLEEETRKQVAEFLPRAVKKAIESYDAFIHQADSHETAKFSSHHTACKAALAHVHLLLKLSDIVDIPIEQTGLSKDVLAKMIERSRITAAQYADQNIGADDQDLA